MIWAALLAHLGLDRIAILKLVEQLYDADLEERTNVFLYLARSRSAA